MRSSQATFASCSPVAVLELNTNQQVSEHGLVYGSKL